MRRAMPSRSILTGSSAALSFSAASLAVPSRLVGVAAQPRGRDRTAAAARLQRDQVRPRAAREAQVEAHAVVDRIESAHRDEVEIPAVGIERRAESRNSGSVSRVVVPVATRESFIATWRVSAANV